MTIIKINPNTWYSMNDLVTRKMLPWAKTFPTVRKYVAKDAKNGNILKATTIGTGMSTRYLFKGENIIKFIKTVESGKARL